MKIPYVIDNETHRLADVLNAVLAEHGGRALDVATAYFNVQGFRLLKEGLLGLGSFRYGLTPEEVSLLRGSAPPRDPLALAEEEAHALDHPRASAP